MTEQALGGLRGGFDIVQISQVGASVAHFGDAFKNRLFTQDELSYANRDQGLCMERLAARFAAKEALIKALHLSEEGVDWREIEVIKKPDGDCTLQLHGHVAELACEMGATRFLLSMSHDGGYAGAVVMAFGCVPQRLTSD